MKLAEFEVNSSNTFIDGESLDVILRHYRNINILIRGVKGSGEGWKTLSKWDEARGEPFDHNVKITIKSA
jgi:hypothetical protein